MWLLLLEMLIALGLALFIVWWVAFPSRRKKDVDQPPNGD